MAQRDGKIQLVYLKEIYIWFMTKLKEVNLISRTEAERELAGINLIVQSLSSHMRQIVCHKVKSSLINEEERMSHYKSQFENPRDYGVAQRTEHPGIPQASIRIK